MEDTGFPLLPKLSYLLVELSLIPLLNELRLPLGEVRLHLKVGSGQIEGGANVHLLSHFFLSLMVTLLARTSKIP